MEDRVPEKIADFISVSGNDVFISKTERINPQVLQWVNYVKEVNPLVNISWVEQSDIAKFKDNQRKDKSEENESSKIKREAIFIINEAKNLGVSDIHIDVDNDAHECKVFYRILGDMTLKHTYSAEHGLALCRVLVNVLADKTASSDKEGSDSFEQSKMLDLVIPRRAGLPEGIYGVRIRNTPSDSGNHMILRLLHNTTGSKTISFDTLGFTSNQQAVFANIVKEPKGMFIVVGPTGSGKSTTLNAFMSAYMKHYGGRKAAYTIEDPVEQRTPGVIHTSVPRTDTLEQRRVVFQKSMVGLLRSDPDLIMVGEIRDGITANLAFEAANTGHLVVSTLHANDALSAFKRMVQLGVPDYLVYDASLFLGVSSQLLVKKLCPHCKVSMQDVIKNDPGRISKRDIDRFRKVRLYEDEIYLKGDGCGHCRVTTGYSGRTVMAQVIRTDEKLMEILRGISEGKKKEIDAIEYLNSHGMVSMFDDAIDKIRQGLIDPFDVEHVMGPLNHVEIIRDGSIDMDEIDSNAELKGFKNEEGLL